jgi:carboxypeptidase D
MNVYDIRLQDEWPACGMNWPLDLPDVYDYLRVGISCGTG